MAVNKTHKGTCFCGAVEVEASGTPFAMGYCVMTDHPGHDFTDVFAAILLTVEFRPSLHVNYASAVLRVRDGLPKLRDFPAEMGGTGDTMPE